MTPEQLKAARQIAARDAQEVLRLVDGEFVVDPADFSACQKALQAALGALDRMKAALLEQAQLWDMARPTLDTVDANTFAVPFIGLHQPAETARKAAEAAGGTMTRTEIEAELYRLQAHTCDGRLTIRPDGKPDPEDRGCRGCARVIELQNKLRELAGKNDETAV